ncbi:MAG TPA: GNAT family N-acetyltransferase, partial [Frankiaceae bacterium]|nr:GNAT family N-acetyltransferase [Frankiaceae bacterium]
MSGGTVPADPAGADPLVADAVLADGRLVHLRPVRPQDAPALLELHDKLSETSLYMRFFTISPASARWFVDRVTRPPAPEHAGLVAEVEGRLVGVAAYERLDDPTSAEISFTVADAQHGRGVGTLLLEHLVAVARARGVTRFVGEILSNNVKMLTLLVDAGLSVSRRWRNGVICVDVPLREDEAYRAAVDERDARSVVRSLVPLLRPRSVAVVGAGRSPRTVGHEVLRNLIMAEFEGAVYPVNLHAATVAGLPAYPRVEELPDGVDLAVVAVPAAAVLDVVRACGTRGVRAVVVLAAGFADDGEEGAARQRAVLAAAREAGMRLVGPNCLGVANTAPDVRLDATFAPDLPTAGRMGVVTQSGGLGLALLQEVRALGLGVSTFVSFGNKADVSANDMLLWYADDDDTDVVVLYLESFGNPRRFARIARRVGRHCPVVAVKGGRSKAGTRGARSHTAAAASAVTSV